MWTRVESWASFGFPDLVGYTEKRGFFTVELKVTKSKKLTFSPHQIAFHVKHPTNTFILAQAHDQRLPKLYPGSAIRDLCACGLESLRLLASLSLGPSLSACSSLDHLRPCALALPAPIVMRTAMKRPATYSRARRLVLSICYVLNITIPAGPAIAARVPLVRSWAASASCNDRRR